MPQSIDDRFRDLCKSLSGAGRLNEALEIAERFEAAFAGQGDYGALAAHVRNSLKTLETG